ncbi:hypothetical protein quinque_000922 [Culex quinquefasciatus]
MGLCPIPLNRQSTSQNTFGPRAYVIAFVAQHVFFAYYSLAEHRMPFTSTIVLSSFDVYHMLYMLNAVSSVVHFYHVQWDIASLLEAQHQFDQSLAKMDCKVEFREHHIRATFAVLVVVLSALILCAAYYWYFLEFIKTGVLVSWRQIIFQVYILNYLLMMLYGTYCHNHSHKYIAMGWAKANNVYDTVKPLFYHLKLFGLCADIPSPRITPKNDIRLKMYLPFFIGFFASITFLRISRHDLVINSIISSFIFEMAHTIGTLNSVNAMVWFYLSQAKIAIVTFRSPNLDRTMVANVLDAHRQITFPLKCVGLHPLVTEGRNRRQLHYRMLNCTLILASIGFYGYLLWNYSLDSEFFRLNSG